MPDPRIVLSPGSEIVITPPEEGEGIWNVLSYDNPVFARILKNLSLGEVSSRFHDGMKQDTKVVLIGNCIRIELFQISNHFLKLLELEGIEIKLKIDVQKKPIPIGDTKDESGPDKESGTQGQD